MVLGFLVDLTIVNNQSQGSPSWFSNQETRAAVVGLVPLLTFLNKAGINTFLDLALDFFNLFLRSGVGTTPHSCLLRFRFQFHIHLDQFFTGQGRQQGAEHLLIGKEQFLQSGFKVKTLNFLQEILLSMEVALTMLFFFCRSAVSAGTEPSSHLGGHCCP